MIEDKITSKYIIHITATMELEGSEVKSDRKSDQNSDPGVEDIMKHLIEFGIQVYKERKIENIGKSCVCFHFVFLGIYFCLPDF